MRRPVEPDRGDANGCPPGICNVGVGPGLLGDIDAEADDGLVALRPVPVAALRRALAELGRLYAVKPLPGSCSALLHDAALAESGRAAIGR